MTPQVALPPADRELNLVKTRSPGMALGEGRASFSGWPQQTAVPLDVNPQEWIFSATTVSKDSPTGGVALPLSLFPQQYAPPSVFTPQACRNPTLMEANLGSTPASLPAGVCGDGAAGCTGAAVGGGASVAGRTVGGADAVGVVVAAGTDAVKVGLGVAVGDEEAVGRGSTVPSEGDVAASVFSGSGGASPPQARSIAIAISIRAAMQTILN